MLKSLMLIFSNKFKSNEESKSIVVRPLGNIITNREDVDFSNTDKIICYMASLGISTTNIIDYKKSLEIIKSFEDKTF